MESKRVAINEDLLTIKGLMGKPVKRAYAKGVEDIIVQLRDVNSRLEKLEGKLKLRTDSSPTIIKTKSQAVFLLRQHKMLTAPQLGSYLNISRTRANEYLREMEKDGIVEGVQEGRKKFYRLQK